MRIILHLDMNSYFATVEQQSDPFLRGKPICVAGKGSGERTICAALSIEAKQMGLKGAMPVWEAKNLCPQIIVVQADYQKYLYISSRIFKILEEYSPLMEVFSVDEAFLDLSHVKSVPKAIDVANRIKDRIRREVGDYLKCSVGISFNKLLAKLASEKQKPDGLTVIDKNNLEEILAQTPIEDLCGVGHRLGPKLNNLKIKTAADLGAYPLDKLIRLFGPFRGKMLKMMGLGQDFSPVTPASEIAPEKSFGHSYTLPKNLFTSEDAKKVLLKLADKVGRRMRRAGFMGRTIHVYVRFLDFSGFGKRITLQTFTNDSTTIFKLGEKLLGKINKPVRAVGISITNLRPITDITRPILPQDWKKEKVIKATDKINDKYGEFTIHEAMVIKIKNRVQNIPDGRNKRFFLGS